MTKITALKNAIEIVSGIARNAKSETTGGFHADCARVLYSMLEDCINEQVNDIQKQLDWSKELVDGLEVDNDK
jgi:hypothetical protein